MNAHSRTVLITGATRGIGLELAKQLIARGDRVIGTARSDKGADALKQAGAKVVELDVSNSGSVAGLGGRLGGEAVDLLINNAGVSSTSKSVASLDAAEVQGVMFVNAIAPMLVVQSVLANLRSGKGKTICQITSQLGSIANNDGGSSYAYRASKAALNQMNRSLAAELKGEGFMCLAVHPGWVRTDMGGPNATLSVEDSARHILGTLDRAAPADSGGFFNYDGTRLPW